MSASPFTPTRTHGSESAMSYPTTLIIEATAHEDEVLVRITEPTSSRRHGWRDVAEDIIGNDHEETAAFVERHGYRLVPDSHGWLGTAVRYHLERVTR